MRRTQCLLVLFALSFLASGCSVIGYSLGGVIDKGSASSAAPTPAALEKARGRPIRALTTDGRVVTGRLARVDASSESLLVFARPPVAADVFLDARTDSLRLPLRNVRTLSCPGSTMRSLLGGVGLMADIAFVSVARWGALTVPD